MTLHTWRDFRIHMSMPMMLLVPRSMSRMTQEPNSQALIFVSPTRTSGRMDITLVNVRGVTTSSQVIPNNGCETVPHVVNESMTHGGMQTIQSTRALSASARTMLTFTMSKVRTSTSKAQQPLLPFQFRPNPYATLLRNICA